MLYAIRMSGAAGPHYFLLPACFAMGGGHSFSTNDMPAQSRKFSSAGDAALCCASLPFACEVVPLPGTGNAYEPPPGREAGEGPADRILTAAPRRPGVPTVDAIRSFVPLSPAPGGGGAGPAPAATDGEARRGDRLTIDPAVSADSPVVRGTWVTVNHVVSLVVDGWSWADIFRSHPELTEDDIRACLAHAIRDDLAPVTGPPAATDGEARRARRADGRPDPVVRAAGRQGQGSGPGRGGRRD